MALFRFLHVFSVVAMLAPRPAWAQDPLTPLPVAVPPVPTPSPTTVPLRSPSSQWSADPCVLAPFSTPRQLHFQRLAQDTTGAQAGYDVRLVYDFGVLPVYVDTIGEIASAGVLKIATPEQQLTFRCGDANGTVIASLDLAKEQQHLRERVAMGGPKASTKTKLSSAISALALGDYYRASRTAATVTSGSKAPEDIAAGFLVVANAKAATGDVGGAKTALASVKRVTASREGLVDYATRADLRSYQIDTAWGFFENAQRTIASIDVSRVHDSAIQHQVVTARDLAPVLAQASLTSGPLKDLLGEPVDNVKETATPPFEPVFSVQWKRAPAEFVDRLDPIFATVYRTNLRPKPCPSDPPHRLCAVSRARQLGGNHDGWLGRIVFRLVRWEADGPSANPNGVRVEYAVTQRRAGQPEDPWQPCVGNTDAPGAATEIEGEAAKVVDALRQVIALLGRAGPT
jgi:hypothetical protein